MTAAAQISSYLTEVRRRLRLLHLVRDGLIFVASLAILLLALVLAAASLDYLVTLRVVGLALTVGGTILFGFYLAYRMRQLSRPAALARHVGAQQGSLLSDLLSSVELGEVGPSSRAPFSTSLYDALVDDTWRRLRCQPPASHAPARRLKPTAVVVAGAAVLWAVVATSLGGPVRLGASKLFSTAPSEPGRLASEPIVGDLQIVYSYPQHMGHPDRTVASSTGHLSAPRGTLVRLSTTPLTPVESAALVLSWRGNGTLRQERVELARSGAALSARFMVTGEGGYRFELRKAEGAPLLDPVKRQIELEPDAAPRVLLHGPANDLEVTARHRLEIGYTVEDDYGVGRVELVYRVSGSEPVRRTLEQAGPERRRVAVGRFDWDLGLIDLPPGSRIGYWIEARDNDTVSGPKLGRSSARSVRVHDAKEKHAKLLEQQQQLVEEGLRILAGRLLLFEKEPDLSAELRLEKSHGVHRSQNAFVDGLRELRNQMRQDRLAPRATLRSVSQMHRRSEALMLTEGNLLKALEGARRRRQVRMPTLTPLRDHNRELIAEVERSVLLLAGLLDEQRLQSLLGLSQELRETRSRLQELLESYRKTRDEKLRQEILRQIARMERQATELLAQMAKLRQSIPDEYLNPDAVRDLDLGGSLQKLGGMVRSGKLAELDAALAALDKKMREVQGLLEGNLDQYRSQRMSARERAYSALHDQLRGLEAEQRKLAERTGQIVDRYRKRAARLLKSTINPFVRRELSKVDSLRRRVNEIEARQLGSYDQEQLERVKQRIEDLKGTLDQGDLDQALQMGRRAVNGLQVLQDDLSDENGGAISMRKGRLLRSLQKTRAARKLASEIISDLESVFPNPRSLLDADDRRELGGLNQQQQTLRRQTQGLAAQLEKKGSTAFQGPETQQALKESAELMSKAGGKLRGLQPQEAHGAQEAAAEQLAALQRQMKAARQPKDWGAGSPSRPREKIEIPGAESFQPPRAFRQDLLEAMKEKPPSAYRSQVRRYYEELVR
jgi:hypothetical protein